MFHKERDIGYIELAASFLGLCASLDDSGSSLCDRYGACADFEWSRLKHNLAHRLSDDEKRFKVNVKKGCCLDRVVLSSVSVPHWITSSTGNNKYVTNASEKIRYIELSVISNLASKPVRYTNRFRLYKPSCWGGPEHVTYLPEIEVLVAATFRCVSWLPEQCRTVIRLRDLVVSCGVRAYPAFFF